MAGFINERTAKGSVRIGINRGKSQTIKLDGKAARPLSIASLFKDAVDDEIDFRMRFLGESMISFLQGGTPVDTGFARANWQISVGKRSTALGHIQRLIYHDQYLALRRLPKALRHNQIPIPPRHLIGLTRLEKFSVRNGDTSIIITNNVPYMNRLNNGHSKQVPKNFIQKALMEARAEVGSL